MDGSLGTVPKIKGGFVTFSMSQLSGQLQVQVFDLLFEKWIQARC